MHIITAFSNDVENRWYLPLNTVDFYEFKFTKTIPVGTLVYSKIPQKTITDNKVIAFVNIPDLDRKNKKYRLTDDIHAELVLYSGSLDNPKELLVKYSNLIEKFSRNLTSFKEHVLYKKFIPYGDRRFPRLVKLQKAEEYDAVILNYGRMDRIYTKISQTSKDIFEKSTIKNGRAYEKETASRFANIMAKIANSDLTSIDPINLEYALDKSQCFPVNSFKVNWEDLFINTIPQAKEDYNKIQYLLSKEWVQECLNFIQN